MTATLNIVFAKPGRSTAGTVVIFAGPELALGPQAKALGVEALVKRAAATADFKAKSMATLDILAPAGVDLDRLLVVGTGKPADLKEFDWLRLGGAVMGALGKAKSASILVEAP